MRDQLLLVKTALPKKPLTPVLSNILLKGGILTATDSELTISAKVDSDLEILLPPKTPEVISALDGEITMALDGQSLHISTERGQGNYKLATDSGIDDYPEPDHVSELHPLPSSFVSAVQSVVVATSLDQARPAFCGVLVEITDGNLTLTASDTYRLARAKMSITHPDIKVLVPGRILRELVRIKPDNLKMGITESVITFGFGESKMSSRLLEEKYPNVDGVLPKEPQTVIKMSFETLAETVKRASLLAEGKNKVVGLNVEDNLTVNVTGQEGSMEEVLPIEKTGENISLFVNSSYLAEGLKGEGEIQFHGESGPMMLSRENYLYLLLPVKKVN